MAHQKIARRAQRRIGGDAGIAVGAAALQRHRQFAGRHRLALDLVRVGQRLAHEGDAGFHRLAGAADFLDVHRAQTAGELLLLHQPADLVDLAAEAQHDHGGKIRMPRIAAERAAEQRQRLVLRHAAAGLVGQRDHAVDIGKIGQRIVAGERILLEDVGDQARDMRAAVHRGEDADIVARRHAAVGTADAVEGRGQIEVRHRLDVDAVGIVLGEIAHAAVLGVHVLARRDRNGGKADDLAVAADRLADRDRLDRHLVARRNPLDRGDAVGHHHARRQARARDQHAIVGMQADHGCRGHGSLLCSWRIANGGAANDTLPLATRLFAIRYSLCRVVTPCRRNPCGSGSPASWRRSSSGRSRSTASRA